MNKKNTAPGEVIQNLRDNGTIREPTIGTIKFI